MSSYNKRTYKVDDIDFNISPKDTFTQNEKEISYVDYFKTKYDAHVTSLNQPMIISSN